MPWPGCNDVPLGGIYTSQCPIPACVWPWELPCLPHSLPMSGNGGARSREHASTSGDCQGTTCFLLQKHLRVFPTLTSDTFSILWTLTASKFQRHFRVLPIPSPFQQSPMLPHTLSTLTPCPTPLMAAPRPPPPPKVTQRPLRIPHPPI